MEDVFCHPGVFEDFLRNDKRRSIKEFAQEPRFKEEFLARYKRDGLTGPLNWYHAFRNNIRWEIEK